MKEYLLKEKFLLGITFLFTIIESMLQVSLAFILSGLVNSAMEKDQGKVFFFVGVSVFYLCFQILLCRGNNSLKAEFVRRVEAIYRKDLFHGVIDQSIRNFYGKVQGTYLSLLTHNTEDVVDSYIGGVYDILQMVSAIIFALISLIYIDIRMLAFALFVGLIYMVASSKLGEKLCLFKNSYFEELGKNIIKIKELLAAFELIRNNNLEKFAISSYDRSKEELLKKKKNFSVKIANINLYNLVLGQTLIILILSAVSFLVIRDEIRIGDLVAIAQLLSSIINPIGGLNETINERNSSKKLLEEQLAYIHSEKEEDVGEKLKNFQDEIRLENVNFSYGEKSALENLDLSFQKGKKYAIVGESGSGKSTVFKLLMNYFDHYEGKIAIDGREYRHLSEDALCNIIASTQQDIFLFDGSIRENITLFKEIEEDKVQIAMRQSGLDKVLRNSGLKLDSEIQESGQTLSGGERQRIAIARMLLRESPILLLDEVTSSLDKKTSNEILEQILKMKDKTCICITHKLKQENIKLYDEIIELKEGKVSNIQSTRSLSLS
ncbi:MAG: ABC transporter ATP-binding protein [Gallicola sp.]|nr:ABC transporter ATP-binding protein [Gallicola sp.]